MAATEFSPIGSKLEIEMLRLGQGLEKLDVTLNRLDVANTRFIGELPELRTDIKVLYLFGFDTGDLRDRVMQLTADTNTCLVRLENILTAVNDFAKSKNATKFVKLNPAYGVQTTDFNMLTESLEKDTGQLADSMMILDLLVKNMTERLEALPPGPISALAASNPDAHLDLILAIRKLDSLSDMADHKLCPVAAGLLKLEKSITAWSLTKELDALMRKKGLQTLVNTAQKLIDTGRMPPKAKLVPLS